MRTSASQFQLLVDYMERYGDLSKPTEGPQGRANNLKSWQDVTELLNADATGDTKTLDKWRKVWSDLKNNIKKKAARIHRAALGTGGGPASNLRLSDLEQKVLSIVGTRAATGIHSIPEIGLEDEGTVPPPETEHTHDSSTIIEDWNCPGTSAGPSMCPPSQVARRQNESPITRARTATMQEGRDHLISYRSETSVTGGEAPLTERSPLPSTSASHRAHLSPTPLPPTPRRRRRNHVQDHSSPIRRRTRTQTQSDLARQAFVRSDSEWRAFQQETERERLRIQERWADLFGQFLLLGDRIFNILQKKFGD